ncbi:hypothetical protein [Acidicapsa ligni]|uniref:hypothetical protein n=1 Tax=Acidicapsa ligni TaxID=542300 RepID=UPI0021E0B5B2|nr:hypothetical protein [Acidicapsa ligni]
MLQFWFVVNTLLWNIGAKLGGSNIGLNVVILFAAGVIWFGKSWRIAIRSANILLGFSAYVLISLVLELTGPCNDHLQKSLISTPLLIFLGLLGLEIGRKASYRDWLNLQKTAWWSMVAAFAAFFFEMLVPALFPEQANYRSEGKFSGFFSEPSHAAFSLFPCIVILLASGDKKMRRRGVVSLFGLFLISRSSTLIALVLIFLLYRLAIQGKVRQAVIFTLAIGLLIGAGAAIDFKRFVLPTVDRVAGIANPGATENISSLVYLQGWEDAWFNLQRTHGLGLGINMMGCGVAPNVPARYALGLADLDGLNAEDGSFLFSKIVSETGVVGILFFVIIIWRWVQLEKRLRLLPMDEVRFAVTTQTALIFCFVASSFIRGAGYFSGCLLLWIVTVGAASSWQSSLTNQPRRKRRFFLWTRRTRDNTKSDGDGPQLSAANPGGE